MTWTRRRHPYPGSSSSPRRLAAVLLVLVVGLVAGVSQAIAVVPVVTTFAPSVTATNGTSATFSLVFNTSVTGLVPGDVTVDGTASGWTVSGLSGSGASYSVALDGTSGSEGTVIPTLGANTVMDSLSAPGPTAPRATTTLTVDRTAPGVVTRTGPTGTQRTTSLAFTVTFDAAMAPSSVTTTDFAVGGTSRQSLGLGGPPRNGRDADGRSELTAPCRGHPGEGGPARSPRTPGQGARCGCAPGEGAVAVMGGPYPRG